MTVTEKVTRIGNNQQIPRNSQVVQEEEEMLEITKQGVNSILAQGTTIKETYFLGVWCQTRSPKSIYC